MSLLIGPMRRHLHGHKELTDHQPVVPVPASSQVLIPLINGNSTKVEVLVKDGDYVKVGSKIAVRNDNMTVPFYATVSGKVICVQKNMHPILRPVDHLVIENDGKYEKELPLTPLDYQTATREQLVDFMMQMGLVGCGGAGFPTYVKYKFAKDIHTVLINAVECEPYITADYRNMMDHMEEFTVGVLAMLKAANAKEVKISVKETKKDLILLLKETFAAIPSVTVVSVPDVYPMGWERTVVYQVFKKRYEKLPSEVGVIVNNATTVITFAHALLTGEPACEKLVTVSGDGVKTPANVSVRIGTPAVDIIKALGGYTAEEVLLIAGGPMMGKTIPNEQFVVTPYTNAITVLVPKDHPQIACLRCGRCSDYCPAALQPVRINQNEKTKNISELKKLSVTDCIECGTCTYVCPSKLDVTEGVRRAKRMVAAQK